ncbi:MAG: peptidylprolyl isomerase [Nanoarchaeota archaeon]
MQMKKHDFVELDFVGKIKDTGEIFDLTEEKTAKDKNIFNPKFSYKPVMICIGERHLIKGLDEFLEGKDVGDYTIEISPENAFGKRDPKLMRLIPASAFNDKQIRPFPGLRLNLDGILGTVRSVSGGRVIIDFNHPLASKEVVYEVKVKKILTKPEEKIQVILDMLNPGIKFDIKDNKLTIKIKFPEQLQESLSKKIKELIPEIKEVDFKEDAKESQKSSKGKSEKV